jgi:hypothetical protein
MLLLFFVLFLSNFFVFLWIFLCVKHPEFPEIERDLIVKMFNTRRISPLIVYIGSLTFVGGIFFFSSILNKIGYETNSLKLGCLYILTLSIVHHDSKRLGLSYTDTIAWIFWFWTQDIQNDFPKKSRSCLLSVKLYDYLSLFLSEHRASTLNVCKDYLKNLYKRLFYSDCKICCGYVKELKVTECGHCFCQSCLTKMHKCAFCKSLINTMQIVSIKDARKIGRKVYS